MNQVWRIQHQISKFSGYCRVFFFIFFLTYSTILLIAQVPHRDSSRTLISPENNETTKPAAPDAATSHSRRPLVSNQSRFTPTRAIIIPLRPVIYLEGSRYPAPTLRTSSAAGRFWRQRWLCARIYLTASSLWTNHHWSWLSLVVSVCIAIIEFRMLSI